MRILNKRDIRQCISLYAGRDSLLLDFLNEALYGPLQRDCRYLKEIQSVEEIPESENLAKKFNSRSAPWYLFQPTNELKQSLLSVSVWLMDVIDAVGYRNINGPVRREIGGRLRSIKSLDEALKYAQEKKPLIAPDALKQIMNERTTTRDEKIGNIKHVLSLPYRHHLFQILTNAGMDRAAKKAENCLGNPNAPDPAMPHRRRVLQPERWTYFSVRDPDDKSVVTLMVDHKQGIISYEGNRSRNIPAYAEIFIPLFTDFIRGKYPSMALNVQGPCYYGMEPQPKLEYTS